MASHGAPSPSYPPNRSPQRHQSAGSLGGWTPARSRGNSQSKYASISDFYNVGKTLGEGTFGKVRKGVHRLTGVQVAIKVLVKKKIVDVSDVERVIREITILRKMRHPNVIRLYEVIDTPKYIFLIMEFCTGGELFDYIVNNSRVEEHKACKILHQLVNGVDYCHKQKPHTVIHRDLKPENILMDRRKSIKIVDFGLGNMCEPGGLLKTACGSPCYAAPEMIAGHQYDGRKIDCWSLGVILFAMLSGFLPFEDPNTNQLYKKIMKGHFTIPNWVSPEAKDLINRIINIDPNTRYTLRDIRRHEWYKRVSALTDPVPGVIEYHKMRTTIDTAILDQLGEVGYDKEEVRRSVMEERHDHLFATYALMEIRKAQKITGGEIDHMIQRNRKVKAPRFTSKVTFPHGLEQMARLPQTINKSSSSSYSTRLQSNQSSRSTSRRSRSSPARDTTKTAEHVAGVPLSSVDAVISKSSHRVASLSSFSKRPARPHSRQRKPQPANAARDAAINILATTPNTDSRPPPNKKHPDSTSIGHKTAVKPRHRYVKKATTTKTSTSKHTPKRPAVPKLRLTMIQKYDYGPTTKRRHAPRFPRPSYRQVAAGACSGRKPMLSMPMTARGTGAKKGNWTSSYATTPRGEQLISIYGGAKPKVRLTPRQPRVCTSARASSNYQKWGRKTGRFSAKTGWERPVSNVGRVKKDIVNMSTKFASGLVVSPYKDNMHKDNRPATMSSKPAVPKPVYQPKPPPQPKPPSKPSGRRPGRSVRARRCRVVKTHK